MELFGQSLAIADFPDRPGLVGAGMSDWDGYATRLKKKLNYTNTYYHQEPFLDISSQEPLPADLYDFLIATEVFEHVSQPISRAFDNAFRILKPGGVFIFTVPCVEGETMEHFPELCKYNIARKGNSWVLINQTIDGRQQEFHNLIFHGGPGTTVEMRQFGRDSLAQNFAEAGFGPISIHSEQVETIGIVWNKPTFNDAQNRPILNAVSSQPWAARKR